MDWLSFLKIMAMEEHAARAKYQLAVDLAEDDVNAAKDSDNVSHLVPLRHGAEGG